MTSELKELSLRVDKLEEQKSQEALALVEILANVTFFGELKKALCSYALNGQCGLFVLKYDAKNKIPLVSECRIKECGAEPTKHYHIELSNITCTLCRENNELLHDSSFSNDVKGNRKQTKSLHEIEEE